MPTSPHWRCLAAATGLLLAQTVSATQPLQTPEPPSPAPRGAYISPLLPGHHRLTLNAIATHYEVLGEGPLLVIPAPGQALTELSRNFTLVVYDVPGSGDIAAHLDGLRRYLKRENIDLLGQAQGSVPAIAYASRYPERVRRLVLACSIDTPSPIPARTLVIDNCQASTTDISKFLLSSE